MAFKTKTDYFGLVTTGLEIVDDNENKSVSTAEARGEDGFVVAVESFGERLNPANTFDVTKNVSLSSVKLGDAKGSGDNKYVLNSFTVTTSAGATPTVAASGMEVPAAAVLTGGCVCTLPAITISALHHAQLFASVEISGTGAHLTQSTFAATADISTAEIDGVIKAYDLTNGKMTFSGTIQVSDSSYGAPTVSLPDGWTMTSPLTLTNPNADFPSWTFTAEKPLAADS